MTCANYSKWRKETLAEARKQSDAREQETIKQHTAARKFKKLVLDLEKEGLFTYHKGVLTQNPNITPPEWHFYYQVAQSNIVYAVLEDWR